MSCARCHDHKSDPVPTADYYSLVGILRSTDTLYGIGPMGIKGVNDSGLAAIGPDAEQLAGPAAAHLKQVQDQTQERNTARSDRYRVVRRVADHKRQLTKPDARQRDATEGHRRDGGGNQGLGSADQEDGRRACRDGGQSTAATAIRDGRA